MVRNVVAGPSEGKGRTYAAGDQGVVAGLFSNVDRYASESGDFAGEVVEQGVILSVRRSVSMSKQSAPNVWEGMFRTVPAQMLRRTSCDFGVLSLPTEDRTVILIVD